MTNTIISLLQEAVITHTSSVAIYNRDKRENNIPNIITYSDLYNIVKALGTGLISQGVKPGTHVVVIAGRSYKNIITDLALNGCGAIIIPINPETEDSEINRILEDSDSEIAIIESNSIMKRLLSLKRRRFRIRKYIIMDSNFSRVNTILDIFKIPVYSWDEIVERGKKKIERGERQFDLRAAGVKPDDIAYIHYTAGTTSIPKGVLLSNLNFVSAIKSLSRSFKIHPNMVWTSLLPSRNIFERTIDYFNILQGNAIDIYHYTEKNIPEIIKKHESSFTIMTTHQVIKLYKIIRENLKPLSRFVTSLNSIWHWTIQQISGNVPYYFKIPALICLPFSLIVKLIISIPLKRIKKELFGNTFQGFICIGSNLPLKTDRFLNSLDTHVIEGYGLAETCGFVTLRNYKHRTIGNAGDILPGIELEVRNKEGKKAKPGTRGVIFIRGLQIMQGYYKMPELTKIALSDDGWLNTGDIGYLSTNGKLTVTGKEDFQLEITPGKYIEPESIEEEIEQSPLIDESTIIKEEETNQPELIIIPYMEKIKSLLKRKGISNPDNNIIKRLIERDVIRNTGKNPLFTTFKPNFLVVPGSFRIGRELTVNHTKRRKIIKELYGKYQSE